MSSSSLWQLPQQPLPGLDGPISAGFATLWLAVALFFTYTINSYLSRSSPTWAEFKTILSSTVLLSLWYIFIVIDRFMHWKNVAVPYGYILIEPIWELFHVSSTLLMLWGMHKIAWRQFESYIERGLDKNTKTILQVASHLLIFLACLVSFYYLILHIALAAIWMDFFSLETINEVATKRTEFEISMGAFLFCFSLFTFSYSAVAVFWCAKRAEGKFGHDNISILVATALLLARSLFQFITTLHVYRTNTTRVDLLVVKDIYYGVTTSLALIALWVTAHRVSSGSAETKSDSELVKSDIRKYILATLRADTDGGSKESPLFSETLDGATLNLDTILHTGPLSTSVTMEPDVKNRVATEYIDHLRSTFGALNPRDGFNSLNSRNGTIRFGLGRTSSANVGRRVQSDSNIQPGSTAERPERFRTASHGSMSRFF